MYTLINGSPKPYGSNSSYFLNLISSNLNSDYNLFELRKDKYDEILNNINESKKIILAFPLYVDSPPSIVLNFLDYIIDSKINLKDKLIYVVVNCGFIEGKQNITAINIIKNWCKKVEINYGCSILIGAGEIVGKTKYKLISKKAFKSLRKFIDIINLDKKTTDIITTVDLLNNKLFCYIANIFWTKNGTRNNLSISDLRVK